MRFATLPTAGIQPNVRNVRHGLGDLAELADSIRSSGVIEPLVVAPVSAGKSTGTCPDCAERIAMSGDRLIEHMAGQGGQAPCPGGGRWAADLYVLIAGHRRHAAAAMADVAEVPAIVREDLTKADRQIITMLGENGHRADLSPVEEAEAFDQLKLFGYKPAQIAKETGRARTTVDRRLALLKLPEGVREKVHGHQVSLADAEALVEFAGDDAVIERLEQAAASGANFRWELQRARQAREDERAAKAAKVALAKAGVRIIPRPAQLGWGSTEKPLHHLGLSLEQHASCPHHAAVEPTSGTVDYVCTDPSVHTAASSDGGADEGAAAREAQAAEQRQLVEDLRTASGLRADFIRRYLKDVAPSPEHMAVILAVRAACDIFETGPDVVRWCEWLGADVPDVPDLPAWEAAQTELERRIALAAAAGKPGPGLRLTLAAVAASIEPVDQQWRWDQPLTITWLDALSALGYQPSEVERRMVEEAAAKVAAAAAAAAAADQGDEEPADPDNAPVVPYCRLCGCTEDEPCEGGCTWVQDPTGEGDVCSRCEADATEEANGELINHEAERAEALTRGVKSEAISKLLVDTGLRPGDVWLRPGVATPMGRCRECGWEKATIRTGGVAGKHHAGGLSDAPLCEGAGSRVMSPAEVRALTADAPAEA